MNKLRGSLFSCTVALLVAAAIGPAAQSAKDKEAEQAYARALALHVEGKYEEALAKIREAVKLAPNDKFYADYEAELQPLAAREQFDRHAIKAPAEAEQSLDALAKYLTGPAKTDRDKARLIYRWVTDHIGYDTVAYFTTRRGDDAAESVLRKRVALCGGYANLYLALAKRAGLEVVRVTGWAKGVGYVPGQDLRQHPHAWNAVKIDDKWQLVDATWGAGELTGKEFEKKYKEFYFQAPPEQLAFTHLPEDKKWQFLDSPVARDDFAKTPRLKPALWDLGVTVKDAQAAMQTKGFRDFPETLTYAGRKLTLRSVPLDRFLHAGTKYKFEVEAPGYVEMAVMHGGKIEKLKRDGFVFSGEATAAKGDLVLLGKTVNTPKNMSGVLRYKVE